MHSMQIHKARENKRRSAAWQLTVTEELLLKMWKILFTLRHITEAVRFTQQKGNTAKTNLSGNMKRSWIQNSFSGFTKALL